MNYFLKRNDLSESVNQPIISVIITVLNGEKYISEAISSILAQTFSLFELIIIDDGSNDKTAERIKEFLSDDRLILISRPNKGRSYSLNEGIALARGQYIALMDADDVSKQHRFEEQIDWISRHNADICGSNISIFGSQYQIQKTFPTSDLDIKTSGLFGSPLANGSVMMKSNVAKNLLYDVSLEMAEDYDFWTRAIIYGYKFTSVPKQLYFYRVHDNQVTQVRLDDLEAAQLKIKKKYWKYFLSRFNLPADIADEYLNNPIDKISVKKRIDWLKLEKLLIALSNCAPQVSKVIIFQNIKSIYLGYASISIASSLSFLRICVKGGYKIPVFFLWALIIFGIFKIKPSTNILIKIRSMYQFATRSF